MRIPVRLLACAAVCAAAAASAVVAQERRPLSFVDFLELPTVQDPQLSPDGRQLVYVLERADWKANRRIGHIHRINADGSGQAQLTFGERGESSPRWSPDNRSVAFLARRGSDEHNQIYLLDTGGGEARRLTSHETAPGSPTWSPDGRSIYFTASDAKSPEEKEKDRLRDDVYAFDEDNFEQRHVWVTDLQGKGTRITSGDYTVSGYELSPDGKRMVFMRSASPLLEHSPTSEVWVMNADGSGARQLTTNQIPEGNPTLSPDGSMVAFTAGANERFETYYNRKIFVVPSAGGAAQLLLGDAPYEMENVAWAADGGSLFFTANHGVHNQLMKVDVKTRQVTALTSGNHSLGSWTYVPSAGRHVFTRNTPTRPPEVSLFEGGAPGELRRVTDVHADLERRFTIGRQERITWKGQDGQTVEGLLHYPVDYVAGNRHPLIVITHGGPQSSDKFGFSGDVHVYAGKGYAVLRPNYRGSTGYGDRFLRDMIDGYFKQSHLDVMASVEAVISMGVADPDKLVKMGWSAGGHMTNKIITFTDRFKAASSGAGAANWISMYAQSDTRMQRTPWFGGTPWQANAPIERYWEHSPLKDVAKVKTPTLFLVGAEDPRVPMPQSVEMYRALKSNGVPTRLYVAPREGHGWTELRHRLFKLQVEMEWFEKWVHGRTYTWERAPGDEKEAAKKTTTTQ